MKLYVNYLFIIGLLGVVGATASTGERPNVILIMLDDMGYGELACHGNPYAVTPNFDRIHDESMRFTNFHVSPTCAPTRAMIMTGAHEFYAGVTHTYEEQRMLHEDCKTVAQVMKDAGYATGMFGKWHLGHWDHHAPWKKGFEVAVMSEDDSQKLHYDPVMMRNGVKEQKKGYRTDILFDEAMAFMKNNKGKKPFFCYIPTNAVHSPLVVPEKYSNVFPKLAHEKAHLLMGMMTKVDENVGRLDAFLKKEGLDSNTVCVFLSDNGGTFGIDVWNANRRGRKGTPWFGGTHVMSFWRWPGHFKVGAIDTLTGGEDIFPTLMELAGAEIKGALKKQLAGKSLLPLLENGSVEDWPSRTLVRHSARWVQGDAEHHKFSSVSVLGDKYHMVRLNVCDLGENCGANICRYRRESLEGYYKGGYSHNDKYHGHVCMPKGHWALFDIKNDRVELDDLSAKLPEVVESMAAYYDGWWAKHLPRIVDR